MQEAAEILENRILYLEKMNNKVQSKTENARKKANELIKIKTKVKEDEETIKGKLDDFEQPFKDQQHKIQEMKATHEENLNKSKFNHLSHSQALAKKTKSNLEVISLGMESQKQRKEGRVEDA